MKRLFAALPLLVAGIAHADSVEWKLDLSHSSVGFTVPHLVVSSVDGRFKEATAKVNLDDADLTKSQVSVEINTASVDTGEQKRDDHLKGPDFFDVKKFPKVTFKSTKIAKSGASYKLTGKIKRSDFGLKWNKALEAGGVLVGEDVTIDVKAEVTK